MKTINATTLANLPGVNLLPPEIHERRRLQQVQIGLAAAVVASVGAVALLYMGGESGVTSAQSGLADSQQQQVKLQSSIDKLQYVSQTQSAVDTSEAALTQAMASEVHWSGYLADMSTLVPPGVWVTQMTFSETVLPGSLTSPSQAPPVVGAVQLTGMALTPKLPPGEESSAHNGAADWLDKAAGEKGFSDPWVANSAESFIGVKKVVTFTSSVTLTSDALTKRCAQSGVC